ncbi:DNA-deoxyinosine glycosylase [Sulfuriferula sp. AH1]|uniref:DNA-deoxyinosine glycosylase n=1 Tax=Sulfuriferula sp. AH1 TaxID=1985873 RepID=UPI000B3B91FE|nr:DNA-deoxyinosine glycosylase [Sulfuriferula sp. AH1]ARU31357.1 DNA-deoxyinosine glycosylase [Sulfuriferula sp. AH1]
MSHITSFAPVENSAANILILGSMPGVASLRSGQYYAHPRNLFWRIMGTLIQLDPESPYEQRIEALRHARIALWDVLHSCKREGSLDTSIDKATQTPNDFGTFFLQHTHITHVFFNGTAAEQAYRTLVLPNMEINRIEYQRLPSTSPANASIPLERKLGAWQAICNARCPG